MAIATVKSRTIGYLRVSTDKQDLEKNKGDILRLANLKGLGQVEWIEEKISGKVDWSNRKLGEIVSELQPGDSIVVAEFSRLARSLLQILQIIEHCRNNGIKLYTVKGAWEIEDTMQSKIVSTVLGMVAEIERDLISQRTKEALRARKAQGVKLGRPKGSGSSKLDPYRVEIESMLQTGVKQAYIAKKYAITPAALSQWIKKRGISTLAVVK